MTGINKQGVINASGNPNENILNGTSSKEIQYSYPTTSYRDYWSKKTTIIPTASQYTLSFWAKSTVAGDKIRAHYYNPNTTTKCESNQGIITTASDGTIDFTLTTEWQQYWVVYTQSSTTATKTIIFPRMFSQERSEPAKGTGIVSIKMVKFEEGNIPTAWLPNNNDSFYFNNLGFNEAEGNCKIQKNGYIQANEFIEI